MKYKAFYWTLTLLFFFIWVVLSYFYSEPIKWWSIYSPNYSSTDPYYPMISWYKVTFIALLSLAGSYILYRIIILLKYK